ncbi:MAG: serine/threonine-protein kinase [Polyangia bacterium]
MNTCLTERAVLELLQGTLPAADVVTIDEHMASCPRCRRWVSELTRDPLLAPRPEPETPASLEGEPYTDAADRDPCRVRLFACGDRIGRYVVQARVGAGAMGVVYAAYDPELDRKVALKLINPESADRCGSSDGSSSTEHRLRLQREAQAMARLSHPNVVTVHDAGEIDGQVFIAMELIDGTTLREWLAQAPRTAREIRAVMLLAGRGLGAAHESGLVHRDFKLDNVLRSREGRVLVTDFGLARPLQSAEPPPHRDEGPALLEVELTRTGAFLGTPVYMAPEVLGGQPADALSDQFSFCVALYEALYGQRPFSGSDLAAQRDEKRRGVVRPAPAGARVPSWLRRVVLRGLHPQREHRYASMAELLRRLERDPHAAGRRLLTAAGGLGALAALVFGASLQAPGRLCRGADKRLAGVWDEGRRGAVRAALLRTGKPLAGDTWQRIGSLLDAYRRDWIALHTEACEATRVYGTQSDALLSLRMDCLERRLEELRALGEILLHADPELVAHGVTAARALTPVSVCSDRSALTARVRPPEDGALRAQVEALRRSLAHGYALDQAGRFSAGLEVAERAAAAASAVPYRPLVAEALLLHGLLASHAGRAKQAESVLLAAITTAEPARHDEVAARAWVELLDTIRVLKPADSQLGEALATAAVERFGGGAALRAQLLDRIGSLRLVQGQYAEAASSFRAALERAGDDRLAPEILGHLAVALGHLGKSDEKLAALRRALAIQEELLGPQHPLLGELIERLGDALADRREFAESESMYRRALAVRESGLEPTDPRIAESLADLALLLYDMERSAAALPLLHRALQINERAFGPEHPDVAAVLDDLGLVLQSLDQMQEARQRFERALTIRVKALGPEHPLVAKSTEHLARVLLVLGEHEEALRLYQRALALGEKALGPEHPELFFTLMGIGRTQLRLQQAQAAAGSLTRACRLGEALAPSSLAECRYGLGVALSRAGGEPARTAALFLSARAVFLKTPERYTALLADMQGWLDRHHAAARAKAGAARPALSPAEASAPRPAAPARRP